MTQLVTGRQLQMINGAENVLNFAVTTYKIQEFILVKEK